MKNTTDDKQKAIELITGLNKKQQYEFLTKVLKIEPDAAKKIVNHICNKGE